MLVNKRYRNRLRYIKTVKTYQGADINSDHVTLVAAVVTKLKKLTKPKVGRKIDRQLIKDYGIKSSDYRGTNKKFQNITPETRTEGSMPDTGNNRRDRDDITRSGGRPLKTRKNQENKEWMTKDWWKEEENIKH